METIHLKSLPSGRGSLSGCCRSPSNALRDGGRRSASARIRKIRKLSAPQQMLRPPQINDTPMSKEDEITAPMLKYQVRFQHGAGRTAEKVFNHLDYKLRPRLFLLGVPQSRGDEPTPVCLEPADECGYEPKF